MVHHKAEDIKVNAIDRHNMKGSIDRKDQQDRDALIKKYYPKLKEETELDEMIPKSTMYALVKDGKVIAKGSKRDMTSKMKKEGGKVYNAPSKKVGDTIKEEVELIETKKIVAKHLDKAGIPNSYVSVEQNLKCVKKMLI